MTERWPFIVIGVLFFLVLIGVVWEKRTSLFDDRYQRESHKLLMKELDDIAKRERDERDPE